MKFAFFAASLSLLMAGCAVPTAPVQQSIKVNEPFDRVEAAEMIAQGNGSIAGTAFLRQRGGGVVTCAGNKVTLIPATKYAVERMAGLYGNPFVRDEVKYLNVYSPRASATVQPNPPEYTQNIRNTTCDAQGNFEFQDVKDGRYFLVAKVVWRVRMDEGGSLASLIAVQNGKTGRVILSQ